jgi:spectrin alpha
MLFTVLFLQEDKINNLKQFAGQLVSQDHYEKTGINDRLQRVLDRWTRLRQAMMEYRSRLGESQTLQDFSRDAEEIEAWIADKLAAASDEPVKETQNLQVRKKTPHAISFASFMIIKNNKKKEILYTWTYVYIG